MCQASSPMSPPWSLVFPLPHVSGWEPTSPEGPLHLASQGLAQQDSAPQPQVDQDGGTEPALRADLFLQKGLLGIQRLCPEKTGGPQARRARRTWRRPPHVSKPGRYQPLAAEVDPVRLRAVASPPRGPARACRSLGRQGHAVRRLVAFRARPRVIDGSGRRSRRLRRPAAAAGCGARRRSRGCACRSRRPASVMDLFGDLPEPERSPRPAAGKRTAAGPVRARRAGGRAGVASAACTGAGSRASAMFAAHRRKGRARPGALVRGRFRSREPRAAGLRPDRPPGELVVPGALPVQRFPVLCVPRVPRRLKWSPARLLVILRPRREDFFSLRPPILPVTRRSFYFCCSLGPRKSPLPKGHHSPGPLLTPGCP